jgi:hypothetical protein
MISDDTVTPNMTLENKSLVSTWNLLYHLPQEKSWNISSYKYVMKGIDSVEKVVAISEIIPDDIIRFCMLFVMLDGITPMWEDKKNRNGGCFSYKVINKFVPEVWNELVYSLCGHTLTVNKKNMNKVTGITISPKKNFCIIKIWLTDCTLQDPSSIVHIENLTKMGCLFKKHEPEF